MMETKHWYTSGSGLVEIEMTAEQAASASHPGPCDADVAVLVADPVIAAQLDRIGPDAIRKELAEHGAWDDAELADDAQNRQRIVWIAANDITEELYTQGKEGDE